MKREGKDDGTTQCRDVLVYDGLMAEVRIVTCARPSLAEYKWVRVTDMKVVVVCGLLIMYHGACGGCTVGRRGGVRSTECGVDEMRISRGGGCRYARVPAGPKWGAGGALPSTTTAPPEGKR
jgi:hypothetical protein